MSSAEIQHIQSERNTETVSRRKLQRPSLNTIHSLSLENSYLNTDAERRASSHLTV